MTMANHPGRNKHYVATCITIDPVVLVQIRRHVENGIFDSVSQAINLLVRTQLLEMHLRKKLAIDADLFDAIRTMHNRDIFMINYADELDSAKYRRRKRKNKTPHRIHPRSIKNSGFILARDGAGSPGK